jgi:hypothetical protein
MLASVATFCIAPSALPHNIDLSAAVAATLPNELAADLLPAPAGPPPMVEADTVARDEMLIDASGQRQHWPSTIIPARGKNPRF